MTAVTILNRRRAVSLQRAFEFAEALDIDASESLQLAKNEPMRDDVHSLVTIVESLAWTCMRHQQQIDGLLELDEAKEQRIAELEKALADKGKGTSSKS
jgi:hypothetical protein